LLNGLSAFPITPADASGRVDAAGLRQVIGRLAAAGVDSIGLLGSTGTYMYLARAERRRAIEVAAEAAVPLVVGIGALRTDEAVALAQDARAAGAAAGLLAPVSYTPLSEDEVFAHFAEVAGQGGLPLVIYDNFGTTHFRFTPALIGRLARLPGVIGIKTAGQEPARAASHHAELRVLAPAEFAIGYAADWNCAEALLAGGTTWYSVLGGVLPGTCLRLVRAAQAGDAATVRQLDAALAPLWDLFRHHSSLRVAYALAGLLGIVQATPPRPILPLAEPVRQQLAEVLRALPGDLVR
jgi:4-hydroxy-tetrahydrodipicolinate synthase